jgi:hypothetical protein
LSFSNQTIPSGSIFRACYIVLKTQESQCTTGFNSPSSRTEISQFILK